MTFLSRRPLDGPIRVMALCAWSLPLLPLSACQREGDAGRKIVVTQWDTVWQTRPAMMDSLLPSPDLLTYNSGKVLVFDMAALRVVALDATTGEPVWHVGRLGQGPGEYAGVVAVLPASDGGAFLLDTPNRRLTHLGSGGQLAGLFPLGSVGPQPNQACAWGDGRFLMADAFQPFLTIMDTAGIVSGRVDPPWPDLLDTERQSRQVLLRSDGEGRRCLAALLSGRGFALLSPDQPAVTAPYVEAFEVYGVGDRAEEGEMEFWAALDAELVADTVVVLFAGRTKDRYGLVDRYHGGSGAYLNTWLLPFNTLQIAAGGSTLFALDSTGTGVIALRPRP